MKGRCRSVGLVGALLWFCMGACAVDADAGPFRDRIRQRMQAKAADRRADAERTNIAGLNVAMWLPKGGTAPFPLVLFSHGFHGMNRQSSVLMQALAERGYLVLAPNHRDALSNGLSKVEQPFGKPSLWTAATYQDRRDDLHRLVSALSADTNWNARIDWSKVAVVGHSLGGYTALGVGGGWPTWKLDGIKAIVALSPYSVPFSSRGLLSRLQVPVMYQTGTKDIGVKWMIVGGQGAFAQTSSPAELVDIAGANHFTWTNLNKQAELEQLIEYYTISFLDKYVKGDIAAHPEVTRAGASVLVK